MTLVVQLPTNKMPLFCMNEQSSRTLFIRPSSCVCVFIVRHHLRIRQSIYISLNFVVSFVMILMEEGLLPSFILFEPFFVAI